MDIQSDKITICDADVVSFLHKHAGEVHIIEGAQAVLAAYCRALQDSYDKITMDTNGIVTTRMISGAVEASLKASEKRQSDNLAQMTSAVERAQYDAQKHMLTLASSVNDVLARTIKNLDVDHLAETLSSVVQLYMNSKIEDIESGVSCKVDSSQRHILQHAAFSEKALTQYLNRIDNNVCEQGQGHAVVMKLVERIAAASERHTHHARDKGMVGEKKLFDVLIDKFCHEDYDLQLKTSQAHNCDIVIRRLGDYPDVRIEAKAHGEESGQKVRSAEVKRFKDDLLGLHQHGIFVSLHTGIVGKGAVDIELLSNGKYAVFLSYNDYDGQTIYDLIQLIYQLDKHTASDSRVVDDALRVTPEKLGKIQSYIRDYISKLTQIKTHLKESLSLISEMHLSAIEQVITGQPVCDKDAPAEFRCAVCLRYFKTKAGLTGHARVHGNGN